MSVELALLRANNVISILSRLELEVPKRLAAAHAHVQALGAVTVDPDRVMGDHAGRILIESNASNIAGMISKAGADYAAAAGRQQVWRTVRPRLIGSLALALDADSDEVLAALRREHDRLVAALADLSEQLPEQLDDASLLEANASVPWAEVRPLAVHLETVRAGHVQLVQVAFWRCTKILRICRPKDLAELATAAEIIRSEPGYRSDRGRHIPDGRRELRLLRAGITLHLPSGPELSAAAGQTEDWLTVSKADPSHERTRTGALTGYSLTETGQLRARIAAALAT